MTNHTKQIIRELRKRVDELTRENANLHDRLYSQEQYEERQNQYNHDEHHRAQQSQRKYEEARREAQESQMRIDSQRYEARRIAEEVERARRWGDSWGVERGLERLKRL